MGISGSTRARQCDDGNDNACDGCEACEIRGFAAVDGDGYIAVVDFPAPAPPYTVEAWIQTGMGLDHRGPGDVGWRLSIRTDRVLAAVFPATLHEHTAQIDEGWHHLAWTHDGATSRIYLDGSPVSDLAVEGEPGSPTVPLRIGAYADANGDVVGYQSGGIDEIRVSTAVRYEGAFEPARRLAADAETALLLHLDADTEDSSPSSHGGAPVGSVAWLPDDGYGGQWCR